MSGAKAAVAGSAALAALLFAGTASAQMLNPHGTRAERGFGNRDSFAFTVEQIFGFEHVGITVEDDAGNSHSQSLEVKPMGSIYWGDVGLFDISDSGLTLGTLVGLTHIFVPDNSDAFIGGKGDDFTLLRLKPRIGYAGAATQSFGYWLRGGPSLFFGKSGDNDPAYAFAVGAEAYGVLSPYPHFGLLIGPNFDINITGKDASGRKFGLTQYGLSVGFMGELW